jgi:pyridoxal phosphate enzyme (YggS family)
VAGACTRSGRDPSAVEVLPVTKGVSAERLKESLAVGIGTFGENRVQEAERKAAVVTGARWQLVGRLQTNKAARAVELFEVIHSLDSVRLAERLDRLAGDRPGRRPQAVYVQVNVDLDPAKEGFMPDELPDGLARVAGLPNLELLGLMTVGRLVERPADARPTFAALRQLSERLRVLQPRLGPGLSMGMSDDFEVAVEEGATVVRIGRAIFGPRPEA